MIDLEPDCMVFKTTGLEMITTFFPKKLGPKALKSEGNFIRAQTVKKWLHTHKSVYLCGRIYEEKLFT